MAVKMLEVPVHKARILLCNSRREVTAIVKDHFYHDTQEIADTLGLMGSACALSLESDGKVDWHILYSTRKPHDVAHEAVHIGVMVLGSLGITISQENDEVLAYLVDHIVEAFLQKDGWIKLDEFLGKEAPPKRKAKRG
jgi:hypothetical protein